MDWDIIKGTALEAIGLPTSEFGFGLAADVAGGAAFAEGINELAQVAAETPSQDDLTAAKEDTYVNFAMSQNF